MEENVKPLTEFTDIATRIKRALGDYTKCPLCNDGYVTMIPRGWKHDVKCSKCNKSLLIMFKENPFKIIKIMKDKNDMEFPEININPEPTPRNENQKLLDLIDWLKGEKYLINDTSTTMTAEFEREHKWELSRNRMIDKTIKKVEELLTT